MTSRSKSVPRERKCRNWRCASCGREWRFKNAISSFIPPAHTVVIEQSGTISALRCDGHEHAAVPWTTGLFNSFVYVCRQSQAGVNLVAWINELGQTEGAMNYWPGCTRAELSVALEYARRWRPPEFTEGALPKRTTPAGLFG